MIQAIQFWTPNQEFVLTRSKETLTLLRTSARGTTFRPAQLMHAVAISAFVMNRKHVTDLFATYIYQRVRSQDVKAVAGAIDLLIGQGE